MNREQAEEATQEINEMERRNFEGRNLPPSAVVDIIERSCGETAWVSVEDRLPEGDAWVLVYIPTNEPKITPAVHAAYFAEIGWEGEASYLGHTITHWQPLPSPPTGRTEVK